MSSRVRTALPALAISVVGLLVLNASVSEPTADLVVDEVNHGDVSVAMDTALQELAEGPGQSNDWSAVDDHEAYAQAAADYVEGTLGATVDPSSLAVFTHSSGRVAVQLAADQHRAPPFDGFSTMTLLFSTDPEPPRVPSSY